MERYFEQYRLAPEEELNDKLEELLAEVVRRIISDEELERKDEEEAREIEKRIRHIKEITRKCATIAIQLFKKWQFWKNNAAEEAREYFFDYREIEKIYQRLIKLVEEISDPEFALKYKKPKASNLNHMLCGCDTCIPADFLRKIFEKAGGNFLKIDKEKIKLIQKAREIYLYLYIYLDIITRDENRQLLFKEVENVEGCLEDFKNIFERQDVSSEVCPRFQILIFIWRATNKIPKDFEKISGIEELIAPITEENFGDEFEKLNNNDRIDEEKLRRILFPNR